MVSGGSAGKPLSVWEVLVMSTLSRAGAAGTGILSPAGPAPLSGVRRTGSALALLLAPWGFVVANTAYALAIRNGGSDETGAEALALSAAHPMLLRVVLLAGMVGCLLLVPAVMGAFRLAPTSRLVFAGGSLMIAGYICYFAVLTTSFGTLAMAVRGGPMADYAAVIDASESDSWTAWVFSLFIIGNLLGTALFAMGLLVSKAAPAWAALGILMWPVLHVVGLVFFGNEVPQVIGAVLQAIGFAGCAAVLLRRRLPA
jgi:hypothetical protein